MVAKSKFKPGQTVFIKPSARLGLAPKGRFRIVRALPKAEGPVQYRIKGDLETFERIVDESQLDLEE
jgi:hypothetical protein